MANTSYVITLSTPLTVAQMARYIKDTSDPRGQCRALAGLFKKIESGEFAVGATSFGVQTSSGVVARATQTLTLTYGSISNNDTLVIAGVTLTCVTGTPAGPQFKKQTDATVTAANLVALINSLATVSIYFYATSALGVVTITAQAPGKVGNFLTAVGSTGIVVGAATLSGGTGGCETTPVNYARG